MLEQDRQSSNADLIAATAVTPDLVVPPRNIRHVEPNGAKLLNPYEA
ncbi:hypothetical protein [Antarcticirhabdus aurantiaca]|uniref:Uncharacterized protein n=1 Tax=Antarcticirhabdus aurantiaca TaxID=2606717 RepID=A0ACD4NK26_9HYPH|nr:hypothetical protein [Antarcticirhabdus aurantiaca]WAJ27096.1 hypothetical protein OXU80_19885 [Jeongeuplla avenae]